MLAWLSLLAAALLSGPVSAQADSVLLARVEGVISPVIDEHLADAVDAAAAGGHAALLVEMDTPGGLETSMRDIVQTFLTADVPVIVYVAPAGARAASAGAVIAFSAHVAAMAPGTNIGAATPVPLEGDGEVIDKVVEDAAAYVEEVARVRDRNVDFAVDTVREGRSAGATEAVEIGAVDLIAPNRTVLLEELDGRTVVVDPASADDPEGSGTEVRLATAGADVVEFDMAFTRRLLQALANPNLALLLLSIGTLGIIYELASPGGMVGGVIGAIMLILAFFSLAVLPVDLAGILLLLLALGLFAAELFAPGVGVFAGLGAVALVFAGLFLFQEPTGVGVDLSFVVPVALAVALAAVFIGRFAWRSQRSEPYSGQGGTMVGAVGTVREADGETGRVFTNGQLWNARSAEGTPLRRGERVRVVDLEGLKLVVTRVEEPSEPA